MVGEAAATGQIGPGLQTCRAAFVQFGRGPLSATL